MYKRLKHIIKPCRADDDDDCIVSLGNNRYEIKTRGNTSGNLLFDPRRWGLSYDHICLKLAEEEGWWSISYNDLVKMAELATQERTK